MHATYTAMTYIPYIALFLNAAASVLVVFGIIAVGNDKVKLGVTYALLGAVLGAIALSLIDHREILL